MLKKRPKKKKKKKKKDNENINTIRFIPVLLFLFSGLFAPVGEITHEIMHLLSLNTKDGGTQNNDTCPALFCCVHFPGSFQLCDSCHQ